MMSGGETGAELPSSVERHVSFAMTMMTTTMMTTTTTTTDDRRGRPRSLEEARIDLPSTAYYIPEFITLTEEQSLLQKVLDARRPQSSRIPVRHVIWLCG